MKGVKMKIVKTVMENIENNTSECITVKAL